MIIELTGLPGAGKSTFIREYRRRNNAIKVIKDIHQHLFPFLEKRSSILLLDILLYRFIYLLSENDVRSIFYSARILIGVRDKILNRGNVFRNIIKIHIINRIANRLTGIFLIDEGVSHIPYILLQGYPYKKSAQVNTLLEKLSSNNDVVFLDTPFPTVVENNIKRGEQGHRRMRPFNKNSIELYLEEANIIGEIIKKHFPKVSIVNPMIKNAVELLSDVIIGERPDNAIIQKRNITYTETYDANN
jgi:hypothetical protein